MRTWLSLKYWQDLVQQVENTTEKHIPGLGYNLDTERMEDFRSQMLDANGTVLNLQGCILSRGQRQEKEWEIPIGPSC